MEKRFCIGFGILLPAGVGESPIPTLASTQFHWGFGGFPPVVSVKLSVNS
jgi:hypothetical protein